MHLCAERGLQVVFAQPASLGNAANQSSATVTLYFSVVEAKQTRRQQESN